MALELLEIVEESFRQALADLRFGSLLAICLVKNFREGS